jgi:hypothetical protein
MSGTRPWFNEAFRSVSMECRQRAAGIHARHAVCYASSLVTPRDQLHCLVDAVVGDETTSPQVHANIDALYDADLPNELERMETLRLLFEEQAEAYSAQRHNLSR